MPSSSTSKVEYNPDDEITIERKVKVVERELQFVRPTTKMGAVDEIGRASCRERVSIDV